MVINNKHIFYYRKYSIVLICIFSFYNFSAQTQIDSLMAIVNTTKNDSVKIYNTLLISEKYSSKTEFSKSAQFAEQGLILAEKYKSKRLIALAKNRLAHTFYERNLYKKAIPNFENALSYYVESGNRKGQSQVEANLGLCFNEIGQNDVALEYLLSCIKIKEELKDEKGCASSYLILGNIFQDIKNFKEANNYYKKALAIRKKTNDLAGQSSCYNNIGNIFYRENNLDSALIYYQNSISLKEKINDRKRLSTSYNNIGSLYHKLKKYDIALTYFDKALKNNEIIKSINGMTFTYINFAQTYLAQAKINDAYTMANMALKTAQLTEASDEISQSYLFLAKCDSAKNDFKSAYANFIEFYLNDKKSFNENSNKKMLELKSTYDAEKKEQEIALLNKNTQIQNAELEKQKLILLQNQQNLALLNSQNQIKELSIFKKNNELAKQALINETQKKDIDNLQKIKILKENEAKQNQKNLSYQKRISLAFAFVGILAFGLLILAYKAYKQKLKANEIITLKINEVNLQKNLVEEKQKEIIQSIQYAKRIQESLLPNQKYIHKNLNKN